MPGEVLSSQSEDQVLICVQKPGAAVKIPLSAQKTGSYE